MGHGEGTCPNSYVMCDVVKGHSYVSVTRGLVQPFSIPLVHHLNVYLLPVPFLSLHGFWFRNYFRLLLGNSHFPPFIMTGIQILQRIEMLNQVELLYIFQDFLAALVF